MERHALTFTVRSGAEEDARRILASYPRPATEIEGSARLLATSVFFWENRVVRVIDVEGPLPVVMRHLANEPAIRETEERLNPLLSEPRDLSDPAAAAAFFQRAMMRPVIHRVTSPDLLASAGTARQRIALRYPVRHGNGDEVAAVLAGGRPLALGSGDRTVLASTTVFQQGDVIIRLAEFVGGLDEAEAHLSRTVVGTPVAARLNELLESGWDLGAPDGFRRFFEEQRLSLVTDRRVEELAGS